MGRDSPGPGPVNNADGLSSRPMDDPEQRLGSTNWPAPYELPFTDIDLIVLWLPRFPAIRAGTVSDPGPTPYPTCICIC